MSFLRFFTAELRHRFKGAVANLLVVAAAAAVVVFISLTSASSLRAIQLITKNMGQNLFLISDSTRPDDFYNATGREATMPQGYIDTLLHMKEIVTTYHVGLLQKRDRFAGTDAILTGVLPVKGTREFSGKKNPFIEVEAGTIRLGSEVALVTGLKWSDTVTILGRTLRVAGIADEKGTTDDVRVFMALSELQGMLNLPGRIHAILSMECLCEGEPLSVTERRIRQLLTNALPDTRTFTLSAIAVARYEAREATDKNNRAILMVVLMGAFLFIVIQTWTEAARKDKESALMKALGFPARTTLLLYGCKAVLIALPGAWLGFQAGQAAALKAGSLLTNAKVTADPALLPWVLGISAGVMLLGFLPAAVKSLSSEPFDQLREE